ncbi:hypothetical protein L1987_38759 [Smallanthus sonchifolius]|uniref:Uncharacterized protein n=1 Tax=Smallanthus sonchifolius TaxID=185202 RepID=A0ACB9HK37_9ASTR|nr:hypothetical protein L1987_38759 [Smallanthus sonchifolius]
MGKVENNRAIMIRDNFTIIPLQCPLLTTTNYTIWVVKLKAIFNVHGLWEVIEPGASVQVDAKKNNAVIAYLFQAMSEELVLQEEVPVRKLLDSVPERFIHIVASIEQFVDLDTMLLQEAIGQLKAFEERTGMKNKKWEKNDQTNKYQKGGSYKSNQKRRIGDNEHSKSPRQGEFKKKDKSKIKCFKCDVYGHYSIECPGLKTRDTKVSLTQTVEEEPALLVTVSEEVKKETVFLNEHKSVFSSLDRGVGGKVRFGDGSCVTIEGRGSVVLKGKGMEQRLMTDVYFIPHLKSNILSLGQATEGGCEVRMKDEFLWMFDKKGKLLMKVLRSPNRLYKIKLKIGVPNPAQVCEACLARKHSRQSFLVESHYRAARPLELISIDMCGPIQPTTHGDNKYFLLVVDDCTRYMWVYMLKTKYQAFDVFRTFKFKVENELGCKIKALKSDRGGEFLSQEFTKFCEKEGIRRLLTTPYSPQQNGAVERRNRSLTRALKNKTPYEALKGRVPNLQHLRIFGCVGHVKLIKPGLKKLDDKSMPMAYLGVETGSKAHRMYDVVNKITVVSRDVQFDESKKWNWSEYVGKEDSNSSGWNEFCVNNDFEGHVLNLDGGFGDQENSTSEPVQENTQPEPSDGLEIDSQEINDNELRKSSRVLVLSTRLNDYVLDGRINYGANRQEC